MKLDNDNLSGKIFNRWKVIEFSHQRKYLKYFVCECLDCGKQKTVYIGSIISGQSKSCGCISKKENAKKINKKYNEFYIDEEDKKVTHVILNDNKEMLCDTEDWTDKIPELYWTINSGGYACTNIGYHHPTFHRLIMNNKTQNIQNKQIDHINGNKLDNRKSNLRICNNQENSFNKNKNKNNTSGFKGVYYDKDRKKWRGSIQVNGKKYNSPKRYNTPEEAHDWYVEQSNLLFGEFSFYNKVIKNE